MSNISKAEKKLKKKLSFDDYVHSEQQAPCGQTNIQDAIEQCQPAATPRNVEDSAAKIKVTYYLSEEDHGALTDVYIKRLKSKQKTDRSALVSEAIRLLYKKEIAE